MVWLIVFLTLIGLLIALGIANIIITRIRKKKGDKR